MYHPQPSRLLCWCEDWCHSLPPEESSSSCSFCKPVGRCMVRIKGHLFVCHASDTKAPTMAFVVGLACPVASIIDAMPWSCLFVAFVIDSLFMPCRLFIKCLLLSLPNGSFSFVCVLLCFLYGLFSYMPPQEAAPVLNSCLKTREFRVELYMYLLAPFRSLISPTPAPLKETKKGLLTCGS